MRPLHATSLALYGYWLEGMVELGDKSLALVGRFLLEFSAASENPLGWRFPEHRMEWRLLMTFGADGRCD
jgi:hypothetical protein